MFDPKTTKKLQTQSSRHRNTGPKVVNRLNLKIKTPTIDINININIDNVADRRWTWKQITSTVSWQDSGFNWTHRKRLKKWEFRVLFLFNLSKLFPLLCWLTPPPPLLPSHMFCLRLQLCAVVWLWSPDCLSTNQTIVSSGRRSNIGPQTTGLKWLIMKIQHWRRRRIITFL